MNCFRDLSGRPDWGTRSLLGQVPHTVIVLEVYELKFGKS